MHPPAAVSYTHLFAVKTLIVDDERLARTELKRLLAAHPEVQIVAEAENGHQAVDMVHSYKPQLLFLDIQMPGKNGFEVLESLDKPWPRIIFTTAFDEYALKAFDFSATDYLLKPVDPERLQAALAKLPLPDDHSVPTEDDGWDEDAEPAPFVTDEQKTLGEDDQVFIRDGDKCYFIKLGQVRVFESIGNYVRLHFDGGKPMILRSLNALEERLDPHTFFRANRKHIVNLKMVGQVEPYFSGGLLLKLNNDEKIEVSRRQATRFRELMSL